MPQHTTERREYVRATLVTQVNIEPIEDAEFERIKAIKMGPESPIQSADEGLGDNESLSGPVLQWLIHIDEKLNRILQRLSTESEDVEAVCVGEARNISGVGLNLVLSKSMPIRQKVLLSFLLPGFSASPFQAYGDIVRVTPKDKDGEKIFEVAVKFIIIDETEREKLIAYAFCQQRRAIRNAAIECNENEGDV